MLEHKKSGGSHQGVECKKIFLPADEWKKAGCICLLQLRSAIFRKYSTIEGPYCGECGGRPEGQENIDSESERSGFEKGEARRENDLEEERGKVEKDRSR